MFLFSLDPGIKERIFGCETAALIRGVTHLLQQQQALLDTATVLSAPEMESYETRSEQIGELIRLLAQE
ncbi:MAG: hypothetical protein ACRD20_08375 [Terriglobales bacterium]